MSIPHSGQRRHVLASFAVAAAATLAAAWPQPASAYDEQSTSAVNVDANGVALKGYDPVSYFSGAPAQGNAEFTALHDGAIYRFASAGNRDAFKGNPGKFAPGFGGYCAMGVAMNKKLDIDPQLWRVVDGRLYLNVHKPAQARWLEDVKGNLAQAEKNWPGIMQAAPKSL